jgi:hypothetical protein
MVVVVAAVAVCWTRRLRIKETTEQQKRKGPVARASREFPREKRWEGGMQAVSGAALIRNNDNTGDVGKEKGKQSKRQVRENHQGRKKKHQQSTSSSISQMERWTMASPPERAARPKTRARPHTDRRRPYRAPLPLRHPACSAAAVPPARELASNRARRASRITAIRGLVSRKKKQV